MEIKEEVKKILEETKDKILDQIDHYEGSPCLLSDKAKDILTDKLIAIFDKEKKEYAKEMCEEFINKVPIPDFSEYYSVYIPSQLTATKLEGEK